MKLEQFKDKAYLFRFEGHLRYGYVSRYRAGMDVYTMRCTVPFQEGDQLTELPINEKIVFSLFYWTEELFEIVKVYSRESGEIVFDPETGNEDFKPPIKW